MSTLFNRR